MPDRAQSANRLTERIHAAVRAALDRAQIARAICACSGGADSTCLAHAAAIVARQTGVHVTICHVQHHVRADDDRDAAAARALANAVGADFRLVHLPVAGQGQTRPPSESAMRDLRYRALAAMAEDEHADAAITGHTLDDQAETVLLHLMRGAGLDGLRGIGEETSLPLQGGCPLRVIRPLLSVRHDETVAYCEAHNLAIVHDPTNDDLAYTRNWMRHVILPALRERNPDVVSVLARASSLLRDDAAFLAAETTRAMARCGYHDEAACTSLRHDAFVAEHVAIQRRILRRLFEQTTGHVPRASDICAAQRHAAGTTARAMREFGGVASVVACGRLVFGVRADVVAWMQHAVAN